MNEHPMSIEIRKLEAEIERLKGLLVRAADAMERPIPANPGCECDLCTLVHELRKAAE